MKFNAGLFLGLAVGLWFARESLQQALEAQCQEAARERARDAMDELMETDCGDYAMLH